MTHCIMGQTKTLQQAADKSVPHAATWRLYAYQMAPARPGLITPSSLIGERATHNAVKRYFAQI